MDKNKFVGRKILYKSGTNTFFPAKHRSRVIAISKLENTNMHSYVVPNIGTPILVFVTRIRGKYTTYANATYIIDGGYLLHVLFVWDREDTFDGILDKYIQYVRRHFRANMCK